MKLNRKTHYTRMVIKDSLINLLKQRPISKITVTELCKNADINRTTFYSHFTDTYDLLRQIEDETLAWVEETINKLVHETDKNEAIRILEGVFKYFDDNGKHFQVLMSEQGDINFQKQLLTLIYKQCGIITSKKVNLDEDKKELYFIFVVNGSVGLIQHWLKDGFKKPPKEMAEVLYNMASIIM